MKGGKARCRGAVGRGTDPDRDDRKAPDRATHKATHKGSVGKARIDAKGAPPGGEKAWGSLSDSGDPAQVRRIDGKVEDVRKKNESGQDQPPSQEYDSLSQTGGICQTPSATTGKPFRRKTVNQGPDGLKGNYSMRTG